MTKKNIGAFLFFFGIVLGIVGLILNEGRYLGVPEATFQKYMHLATGVFIGCGLSIVGGLGLLFAGSKGKND